MMSNSMMRVVFCLALMLTLCSSQLLLGSTCTSRRSVDVGANSPNVLIGGLFPLRTPGYGNYGCGPVGDAPYNMQEFEAARFAISRINDVNYIPGVRLGMRAYDTCSSASVAASAASDFLPHLSSTASQCSSSTAQLFPGIVGGHFSEVTKSVASVLQGFDVAQVAYSSRSEDFNNVFHYPNLLRTDAPAAAVAEGIAVLLEQLQWEYIGIVFTDDEFGQSMKDLVLRETYKRGICTPHVILLPANLPVNATADKLRPLVQSEVVGVVYAGSKRTVPQLFQALSQLDPTQVNSLQWVFPWTKFSKPFTSTLFRGSLSLTSKTKTISEFANYFSAIDPLTTSTQNPWFQEWYMFTNNCRLPTATNPLVQSFPLCVVPTATQRRAIFRQGDTAEQVIKAVYVFANALRRARNVMCQGAVQNFCTRFTQMTAAEFLGYVKSTSFTFSSAENIPSLTGTTVRFDSNLNLASDDGFDVYNYNDRTVSTYQFEPVGAYTRSSGLSLNTASIRMYGTDRVTPLVPLPKSLCNSTGCSYCVLPPAAVHYYTTPAASPILIAGLFGIHFTDPLGYTCKDLDIRGSMTALAYFYALDQARNRYPGLNLGGLFIDSCNRGAYIADHSRNFLQNHESVMDQAGNKVDPARVMGYVDASHSRSALAIATALNALRVPDVGTTALASPLQNSMELPYFKSSVPPDSEQARAMVQFLTLSGFTYLHTVHRPDVYGRHGQMDFKRSADMYSVCIAGAYELGKDGTAVDILNRIRMTPAAKVIVVFGSAGDVQDVFKAIKQTGSQGEFVVFSAAGWGEEALPAELDDVASGSFTLSLQTSPVPGFVSYLQGLDVGSTNIPFFSSLFEEVYSCSLDPQNMRGYTAVCDRTARLSNNPNAYSRVVQMSVQFTIRAVELYAQVINDLVQEACLSQTPCPAFYSLTNLRERIIEKLRAVGQPLVPYTYQILNYRPKQTQKFFQVASYNPVTRVTSLGGTSPVFPNNATMTAHCTGFCQHCSYLMATQPYMATQGDIMIGALVGMSKKESNPFLCMTMKPEDGFQYSAAIQYAIERINSGRSSVRLKGVSLGALILDDCDSSDRTFSLLGELYSNSFRPQGFDMDTLRAWLTFSSDSTMEGAKFLGDFGIPVVSPLASAVELRDRSDFPSLYLTVPRLDKLVSAIVQLVRALGFPYIQVLYSPTAYGRSGMEELEASVKAEGICIVSALEINPAKHSFTLQSLQQAQTNVVVVIAEHTYYRDVLDQLASDLRPAKYLFMTSSPMKLTNQAEISVTLEEPRIPEFTNFLSTQTGDSFMRYYQERFQCKLPGTHYSRYSNPCPGSVGDNILNSPTDLNVLATINAVDALAAAIHRTLQYFCGMDYDEVCSTFELSKNTNEMILQNLGRVSFQDISEKMFLFLDRESPLNMVVLQRVGNSYTKVGSFDSGYLRLMDTVPETRALLQSLVTTPSACLAPCTKCIEKSLNFTFIPGDVYIGGMFDVHTRSISPFTCGKVKTLHGFQLLEAFQFAVQRVNAKLGSFSDKLNGVTLGAIGMDSCESAVRTGYQVSNIHNGRYIVTKNSYQVDASEIKAYVAAYESDRTKYLARILSSLGIPQVSYGATSIDLNDKDRYPFFIRTVPSDDHQSDAILAFLNDQDMRYVQILSSPTDYGRLGSRVFMERAEGKRICIAQQVVFPDNGTVTRESANDAVTTMLDKPLANVIVIFADTGYLNEFLLAVKRNSQANRNFRFVGSIMWSLNFQVDPSVVATTLGAITLNLESADMAQFDTYLTTKTPANYRENPWFDEYYEEIRNCYLRNPFGNLFQSKPPCGTNFKSVVSSSRYIQDPGVLHVVNSVYASAHGIDYALRQLCGANYTGVCELFRSSPSTNQLIFEGIEMARFKDETGADFEFTSRRDGNKGYTLYSITESTANENGYVYDLIGSYRNQSGLTMGSYRSDWNGSCDRARVCTECPGLRDSVTRYMEVSPGVATDAVTATIIGVFDLHKSKPHNEFLCGEMNYNTAFHNIMAFYYTLEKLVNNQPEFSSKLKFNGLALDTCSSNIRVDTDLYGLVSGNGLCHADAKLTHKLDLSNIGGVLTMGDDNTFAANRVLSPLAVSMVSPDASSMMLQKIERYNYLLRAKPPSTDQAMAILAVLRRMGWNYVSVVYSDNIYGTTLQSTMMQYAGQDETSPVCVGLSLSVPDDASSVIYRSIAQQLDEQGKQGARVVVLLTTKEANRGIIAAIKSSRPESKFILFGTDSWAVDPEILRNQETFLAGAITLSRVEPQVDGFKQYFAELSYAGNHKGLPNDWFEEWYQHAHTCHLPDTETSIPLRHLYPASCDKNILLNATTIKHDTSVFHTILSTYAIAKGLSDAVADCNNSTLTECLKSGGMALRNRIFSTTQGVEWAGVGSYIMVNSLRDYNFEFNQRRFSNTGYKINSVVYGNLGRLEYKAIGNWTSTLMVDTSYYTDKESKCLQKDLCSCAVFGSRTGALTSGEELGDLPRNYYDLETTVYSNGTTVYTRRFDWPIWAIVVGILTSLGIFVCIILFVVLICCYPVKTGTTILGFLLLIGIIGIYAINFAFFLPASPATCGARRFIMGIVYAICFAALLVKAADNWRYGEFDTVPKKYHGITSAIGLLLIALFLILIQVIIPIMWLMVDQPVAFLLSNSVVPHDWWWCGPPLFYDQALVLSFIYVMILVLLTIIFAVLAWYNTNNYYESRWILGVSIATAGVLMVWMLVSTMAAVPYRDAAVAVGNWVNATILLICLPLRKTYLLFQVLRYGSEEDESEKDEINAYSREFVNHTFDADDYQYNTKSMYSMNGKSAVYSTQGGEVVLQRAPEVTVSEDTTDLTAREMGEQVASMSIGQEEVAAGQIVVESSGSAAVAAQAPAMTGEGLAVAKLVDMDGSTTTHVEVQSSYKQEEYVTYNTEYETEIAIEPPSEEIPDPVIITEPVSSGGESDFDTDSDSDDSVQSHGGESIPGELTETGPSHQRKVLTRSYEVTREETTFTTFKTED